MWNKFLRAAVVLLSIGLASSVRPQSTDPLQAIKDSLSPDQQSSILQNVLGKGGDQSGKKTDQKLENPETVLPKVDETKDLVHRIKKQQTYDERVLRQTDEDPELRADDTVLIELTPIDQLGAGNGLVPQNNGNGPSGNGANFGANGAVGVNTAQGAGGINGINGASAVAGIPAVLESLAEQRVATLLLADDFHAAGARCSKCRMLLPSDISECPVDGTATAPVADLREPMIAAAVRQDATVLVFPDPDETLLARPDHRTGALLRF